MKVVVDRDMIFLSEFKIIQSYLVFRHIVWK